MDEPLTAETFYNKYHEKLALSWVSGAAGKQRSLQSQDLPTNNELSTGALVGHLNLIHPNRIQVLGSAELQYLQSLGKNSYQDTVKQLFAESPLFVVIADDQSIDIKIKQQANESKTPLFSSTFPSRKLISHLQYYLSTLLAERITLHGVFMEVMGIGVLLAGESGVGKSEAALELITRGHRLIADDAPEFSRAAPDTINGICPAALIGFLEVRGLGVLNIRAMFGDSAIKQNKYLRLIVQLQLMSDDGLRNLDRLQGTKQSITIQEVAIPKIVLPVAPGRNISVLIESAVRDHILHLKGYNAAEDFINKQGQLISQGKS